MSSDRGIVIAGGGLAAQRCAETLRRRGFDGRLTIVCGEPELPYDRPPLSKGVLAGTTGDGVHFRDAAWYEDNAVELLLGRRAEALDPGERCLTVDRGERLPYSELLIATGAAPRTLPQLAGFSNVHALRTLGDARALGSELGAGTRLTIVGAGFIGQEVAASALALGAEVTLLEALPLPLAGLLGEPVGRWLAGLHEEEGVRVKLDAQLTGARGNGRVEELTLGDGTAIGCDVVVAGVGVQPAAGWLAGSGIDPAAVLVDAAGRTAVPHVYAAGDVCRAFDTVRGVHTRTEHWDAASRQGTNVALAMLGDEPAPHVMPSFWSDQHGVRIQYVGHAEDADRHVIDGDPAQRDFTVLYSRGEIPVAGLAVGRPRELIAMRRLIEAARRGQPANEPAIEPTT